MTAEQVREMLQAAFKEARSGSAWAKQHGVSIQYAADVASGKREPGAKICQALGIERVVSYRVVRS